MWYSNCAAVSTACRTAARHLPACFLSRLADSQNQGLYMGLAFWPGHATEDWGPVYNRTSGEFGLNPCNTSVGAGNVSDRAYLVSPTATAGALDCAGSKPQSSLFGPIIGPVLEWCGLLKSAVLSVHSAELPKQCTTSMARLQR